MARANWEPHVGNAQQVPVSCFRSTRDGDHGDDIDDDDEDDVLTLGHFF